MDAIKKNRETEVIVMSAILTLLVFPDFTKICFKTLFRSKGTGDKYYRRACQSAVNVADPKPADWGESQIGRP